MRKPLLLAIGALVLIGAGIGIYALSQSNSPLKSLGETQTTSIQQVENQLKTKATNDCNNFYSNTGNENRSAEICVSKIVDALTSKCIDGNQDTPAAAQNCINQKYAAQKTAATTGSNTNPSTSSSGSTPTTASENSNSTSGSGPSAGSTVADSSNPTAASATEPTELTAKNDTPASKAACASNPQGVKLGTLGLFAKNYNGVTSSGGTVCVGDSKINPIFVLLAAIIRFLITILSLLFVGMIIFAGVVYVVSDGQPERVQEAKDRLQSAITGVVLLALMSAILNAAIPGGII
ncbi:MAG TPA: pilin [Candidatus Saccharimonadales bacterium]|nr:pilin [Candidatus Saccharimonadales bacterium]